MVSTDIVYTPKNFKWGTKIDRYVYIYIYDMCIPLSMLAKTEFQIRYTRLYDMYIYIICTDKYLFFYSVLVILQHVQ